MHKGALFVWEVSMYRGMTTEERFWSNVEKTDDCWIWKGYEKSCGYGGMRAYGKNWFAHRLSYTLNIGEIPEGMYVCHKCDNPICVRPDHLFLGTHKDNMADCKAKGRYVGGRGNADGWAKSSLTQKQKSRVGQEVAQ
jgi:hypothetical protein